MRPLSYPHTDVFLLCFSLNSSTSLENVKNKWYPEIQHHSPGTPFILVGTKLDLREEQEASSPAGTFVDTSAGERVASELGAKKYIECSAKTQAGLKDVFDEAIGAALAHRSAGGGKRKKSPCTLL